MNVFYAGQGIVEYEFFKEQKSWRNKEVKKAIEEERVEKAIRIARWIATGVAVAIMVATIAEDVLTGGAGISNDRASIQAASTAYRGAMSLRLRFA